MSAARKKARRLAVRAAVLAVLAVVVLSAAPAWADPVGPRNAAGSTEALPEPAERGATPRLQAAEAAPGAPTVQAGGYPDVSSDHFAAEAVTSLAVAGVFDGAECSPGRFCAGKALPRWAVAVWLVRVLDGREPPPVSRSRFDDVDAGDWWAAHVERLAELGVTTGCSAGPPALYCPNKTVKRSQMAAFLARAYRLPEGPDPGFADVPPDAWYAAHVASLAASGITRGCKDGTVFCPARATTRAHMAAFLHRAINADAGRAGTPLVAIESAAPLVTGGGFDATLSFSKPVTGLSRSDLVVRR